MRQSSLTGCLGAVIMLGGLSAAAAEIPIHTSFLTAPLSSARAAVGSAASSAGQAASTVKPQDIVYISIPKAGKKFEIDADTYLIYEFSERPKMGTVILKIQVFRKNGDKITPFVIWGRSDMPSMRGAHDSGDVEFKLNKRNDYLLPVNIVMPGGWEVRVTFLKDGKPVFSGSITFDV